MDIQEITIESHIDFKKIRSIKICLVDLIDNTLSYAGVCTYVHTLISYSSSCVVAHIENIHTLEKLLEYNIMD